MKTPIRKLHGISYWVIEDPDAIHDFINNELRKEWEEDARTEHRDPKEDTWLKTVSKRRWRLKTVDIDRIKLDPQIMNYRDAEGGFVFQENLAKRSQELKETVERFAVVIWPPSTQRGRLHARRWLLPLLHAESSQRLKDVCLCRIYARPEAKRYQLQPRLNIESTSKRKGEPAVKLLLDEMFTGLKEYLQTLGWDALTVHDARLVGASDKKIVEYTKKHKLLLVTQDEKHADLANLSNVPNILISQIILARMIDAELREKQKPRRS